MTDVSLVYDVSMYSLSNQGLHHVVLLQSYTSGVLGMIMIAVIDSD